MKTFVIGDIHGGYKALKQCLERVNFDYDNDRLISLGDIADGWPDIVECFEELLKIKNLVMVRGNHDQWLKEWMQSGRTPDVWTMQGGKHTLESYAKHGNEIKEKHHNFLKGTKHWFIDEKNRLYVHGGYKDGVALELQDKMSLMWDRSFFGNGELCNAIKDFTQVFVGHTSVWRYSQIPFGVGKVIFMDTGGGWEGKLSIANVDTMEVAQSDLVQELYPNIKPR